MQASITLWRYEALFTAGSFKNWAMVSSPWNRTRLHVAPRSKFFSTTLPSGFTIVPPLDFDPSPFAKGRFGGTGGRLEASPPIALRALTPAAPERSSPPMPAKDDVQFVALLVHKG